MKKKLILLSLLLVGFLNISARWGFYAHKRINRLAVFTLPPEMIGFYKNNIQYITESAINPDARRYVVEGEAPKHFIDIDHYGDSAIYTMPRRWKDAIAKYSEDTIQEYGIVPWNISLMKYQLTKAFKQKNQRQILRLSAEIGHYIGDGNVPLHTTENYNGQMSGQYGIHGFWESRIPELFSEDYDFFVGRAYYIKKPLDEAWKGVTEAHLALDSVFGFETKLTQKMGDDKKWGFETRGGRTIKVYSKVFTTAYSKMLDGQVERRMRTAILRVGSFWYTCWVDAGQPKLDFEPLTKQELKEIEAQRKAWILAKKKVKSREHAKTGVE